MVDVTSPAPPEAGVVGGESGGAPVEGLTGSNVDNLETLQMVHEDWPPCPSIPKSSLRRWLSKRSAHVQDCNFQV